MSSVHSTSSKLIYKDAVKNIPLFARLFIRLLKRIKQGNLHLVTPNGEVLRFGDQDGFPIIILHIHDWRACRKILRGGDIAFAECIESGWVSSNDLVGLLRLAIVNESALDQAIFGGAIMRFWYKLKHLLHPNTKRGSRKNIHAHYDIGNPFYALWLDPSWTYSSALFLGDYTIPLEKAQANKYQRIVEVLNLKAGDHVLEIGCGWGGFALHAATLGIRVHGVTISQAQLEIAQQRITQQELNHLVRLEICDYRDLHQQYDAIVSIEMFEAVGERFWAEYFKTVAARLKAGGKALV
ncbi:MAG: cyclopropane-fatty-acyl-phospholipid synthase family protein, partial [Undibacterium sp.]|nr:cyclopropane-fatty-acyl-phospholipid synthase family protein [Undibacterium sp.]